MVSSAKLTSIDVIRGDRAMAVHAQRIVGCHYFYYDLPTLDILLVYAGHMEPELCHNNPKIMISLLPMINTKQTL